MTTSRVLQVSGTVRVAEGLDLDDAVLTVKLIGTGGEVLAGASTDATSGESGFTLQADPADVPDPRHLRLWARVRGTDATGSVVVWGTPELVRPRDDIVLDLSEVAD